VPCGEATLVFERPRYAVEQRSVAARPGAPAEVSVRLERPPATLQVSASAPDATVKVNGRAVGRAPRSVPVPRFEQVRIEVTAPGHAPWRQTMYVKDATVNVAAKLGSGKGR
jgi:hypothetical protein